MAITPEQAQAKFRNADSYLLRQQTEELDALELRIDEFLVNSGGIGGEIVFAPGYLLEVAQRRYPGWHITIAMSERRRSKNKLNPLPMHLKFEIPPGGHSGGGQ